jgi:hypothetical protein
MPWLTSRLLGAAALAQGRDLGGTLAAVPGSPPGPAPGDGPSLLGTVPTEVELRLEGLSLNDPVDGRAPWELPAALWAEVLPHPGLGPAVDGDRGGAGVDLVAARATRRRAGQLIVGGGVGRAAGTEGGRPDGAAYLGFAEARAELGGGGVWPVSVSVAAAPTRGAWQGDPTSLGAARGRRTSVLPLLGRADGQLGGWTLTGLGLLVHTRQSLGRAGKQGSILAPEEPSARRHSLTLVGLVARRPLGYAPAELILTGGLLASRRQERPLIGPEVQTDARRFTFSARVSGQGWLGGAHQLSAATGLEADGGARQAKGGAALASRQAGQLLLRGEASSYTPFFALDDCYRPVPALEVQAGLRAQKILLHRGGQSPAGLPGSDFSTSFLWAPRAGLSYRPLRGSRWGQSRLHVTAGRFGARLPLAPLLDVTAAPRFDIGNPGEDAALAGADLIAGRWSLSLAALERRMIHPVEDRFSPVDGQLELFGPVFARRRYRGLWAELRGELRGVRGALAVIRQSLRGNHLGWLDGSSGAARPASTEAFDTPASEVNRQGPLPLDRRHGLRLLVEHGRWVGPAWRVEGALAGRLDDGAPRSAQAPNPEGPLSRVHLVEAGSLGRTGAVAALDAALGVSWMRDGLKGTLRLEVLNVGNRRRALTRDPLYTDVAVTPVPGARAGAGLASAVDPDGSPVVPRARHDAPVARAEPLGLRLVLGLAL